MLYLFALHTKQMPIFIVTGNPGVGKTTVVMKLAELLREKGISVGGIISREVRENGIRTGFEFIDINNNEIATLASVKGTGPKVGKYNVNMEGCKFAVQVLRRAFANAGAIICDELGPMEFKSKEFVECVNEMLDLDRPVIVVVHRKLVHPVIDRFRQKASLLINIDVQNRNKAPYLLLDRLV